MNKHIVLINEKKCTKEIYTKHYFLEKLFLRINKTK